MQILTVIKRHGYRLEDVANALGITKGSLSATINGSPNVKKLIEIALVIGCSPAEFFDDWYDKEGKELLAAMQPEQHNGDGSDVLSQANAHAEPSPAPSASIQQAIICPHCKKAMTITVQDPSPTLPREGVM